MSSLCVLFAACGGDEFTDRQLEDPNAAGTGGSGGSSAGGSAGDGSGGDPSSSGGSNGSGGKGGSAGSGGQSSDGPSVASVSPEADAVAVGFDSLVTATFSHALDPATATAANFELERAGSAVSGTVSYEDLVATFTPAEPLALRTTYSATLGAAIADLDGVGLVDAPYNWSFTTADGAWTEPGVVELNAGSAELPQVALDGAGNAIAVWGQSNGTVYSIWANRFTPTSGWAGAGLIETVDTGDARNARLAMDSSGRAVVVWTQSDGTRVNLWASFTEDGAPWSDPAPVDDRDEDIFQWPSVGIDEGGNAVAVWVQSDGTKNGIWASRLTWANRTDPASGWGDAELVEMSDNDAYGVDVAVAPDGEALVVWNQSNGSEPPEDPVYYTWTNRFVPEMGWEEPTRIQPENLVNSYNSRLSINANGDAAAVWIQGGDVTVARFTRATGWGMGTTIETFNGGYAFEPELAIDAQGNIVVVWDHYNGLNYNSMWSNQFRDGAWGEAALVEMDDAGRTDYPKVALDPSGNGVVVWSQRDGIRYNIWTSRYDAVDGWGEPDLLENENVETGHPQVAVDPRGNALAVWEQVSGADTNVMFAYFH